MRRCPGTLLLVLALAIGTVGAARAQDDMTHISQDELLAWIRSGKPPVILDVRSQGEYAAGHVPGALHIPFYAVYARRTEIPASVSEPVIVYCEHGPRAGLAKLALRAAGFEHVVYLEGHMSSWKQRGLPIETAGR
jgi:rhodanese-related sulfurtransferase